MIPILRKFSLARLLDSWQSMGIFCWKCVGMDVLCFVSEKKHDPGNSAFT